MTSICNSLRTALVLSLAASSAMAQSLLSQHGEVVLANGDAAPGIPGATIYVGSSFTFGSPVVDQNGNVLVQARLAPSGTTDRAIFFGRTAADMALVAQSGTQAPGLPAGILLQSSSSTSGSGLENDPVISPSNELVYFGSRIYDPLNPANTPTSADSALFWGPVGGLQLLAREGDQVPGYPAGVTYGNLSISRQYNKINRSGIVTLPVRLMGAVTSSDDAAILTGTPGNLQTVLREGDDAGLGGGETFVAHFSSTLSFQMQINDAGQILLSPKLAGPGVSSANDSTLAIYTPGSGVAVFAREGDQVPGMAAGTTFTSSAGLGSHGFSNSGDVAFTWLVSGPGITSANDQVLFFGGTSPVTVLAQEGDPTGLPGGETFGSINNSSLTTNEAGTIAFYCSLRDATGGALPTTNDSAMFYGTPGNLTMLVREGEVIPAIPASTNGPWVCQSVTSQPQINTNGQVLFTQRASDGVATITFWFVYDPLTGLKVVRDQSETYTTSLGTGQATSSTSNGGSFSSSAGSSCWFNNAGDFAFRQSIDNGVEAAIIKGHSGMLIASPSSLEIASGGTHNFTIDAGPSHALEFYAVIGSMSGTQPGTVVPPLGPLTIPLNFDAYTDTTVALFNTPIYSNTLWFTDANGQASASFNLPPASGLFAGMIHHAVVGLDINLMETFVSEPATVLLY